MGWYYWHPSYGLFRLSKWLRGRGVRSVTVLEQKGRNTVVALRIEGETGTIHVPREVCELYADSSVRKKAVEVLAPLREEGYETLRFYSGDDISVEFERADVPQPDGSDLPAVIPQKMRPSTIKTSVKIRKAVHEGPARWTVFYKKVIGVRINDTAWLRAFQSGDVKAPPGKFSGRGDGGVVLRQ